MKTEPQKEHAWLQQLVGEWAYETECSMEPGKAPEKFSGVETVRPLGDLWILCEGRGQMPGGGEATTLMTLGYDTAKKQYVGTWVGSMMSHLWNYNNGWLNENETVLTLESDGPAMSPEGKQIEGKTAKYRDIVELKSDDHRILKSHMLKDDGEWQEFMTMEFRRIS